MDSQAIKPLRVVFDIDAAGAIYDPAAPPMLDAIIDWALSPMVRGANAIPPGRGDAPNEIQLPLGDWRIGDAWGWCASALIPLDGKTPQESIQHFRKKFRTNRLTMVSGLPNLQSGPTREYNLPYTVQLVGQLVGYCLGDRHVIDSLLRRNVRYIGGKRHRGRGRVDKITVEAVEYDYSLVCDGVAMRWLPDEGGARRVRMRPPYWNNNDRVASWRDRRGVRIVKMRTTKNGVVMAGYVPILKIVDAQTVEIERNGVRVRVTLAELGQLCGQFAQAQVASDKPALGVRVVAK